MFNLVALFQLKRVDDSEKVMNKDEHRYHETQMKDSHRATLMILIRSR